MKKLLMIAVSAGLLAPHEANAQSISSLIRSIKSQISQISAPVGTNAQAAKGGIAPVFGSVEKADIAGVRLGMNPDEAIAALKGMGYTIVRVSKAQNFRQLAQSMAAARNPAIKAPSIAAQDAVRTIIANGPSGEFLNATFDAMPSGEMVVSVSVSADTARITRASFKSMVDAKYGPPTDAQPGMLWYYWCNAGTANCAHETLSGRYAFIQYSAGPADPSLELSWEGLQGARQRALLDVEVNRLAPLQSARF